MKNTRLSLSVLSILVVLACTVSYADDQELYGTWVNTDYNGVRQHAKHILRSDGTWASYGNDSDTDPIYYGTFSVTEKWTDSEGNIWIKAETVIQNLHVTSYKLYKLSNSGKTLETVRDLSDYPTEMNPNHRKYHIYYRK